MAQTIKLRRSATAGAAPTVSQLELGEVAINTYDGKMYIKKDVGGTESIVEIGSGLTPADAIFEEYLYTATSNQTAFSGNDDNSTFLSYVSGAIQVFLNGVLLDPETDYTATNGATVTLTSGAATGDYLQIIAFKKKIGDSSITIDTFSGNNSTTAFTLSLDPGDENNTRVFIDGVYQSKSNYTVSGTTLTFSSAPPSGTGIEVEIGNRAVSLDTTSSLDLPDNVKLRLGTSQDLQLYHDGSNSIISDVGTGHLNLRGTNTYLQNSDGSANYLVAIQGDETKLYFNNSAKIATTSTGINVTGNIVVSGTVDGRDVASDGAAAVAALPRTGGAMTGAITTNSTFDGRDVATDGAKLDGIESGATADQTQSEINALGITATGLSGTPAISVANITTTGELRGPASLVIDPAAVGDNTGTVVIKGNLQVDGATTTINSTTLTVDDLNITLASGAANGTAANGAGITVDGASATITYVSSTDSWDFNKKVKFNTVQAHGSNNFLIDSPAEIHLDSHSGFIRLNTQGGNIGMLQLSNNDFTIRSMVSDRDIIFQGYDGSNNISALTLDMSEAGKANFNAGAYFSDSVGIGATTATTTLDLSKNTDTGERAIRIENSKARLYVGVEAATANRFVGSATDHGFIGTTTNDGLEIATNNTVRMVINTSGNVGIGTSPSSYKLDVNGTVRVQGSITTSLTSSGGTFLSIGHSGNENWSFDAKSGSGVTDYVDFGLAGSTRCMTWQEDGNVGIGTTSPAVKLDLRGDMRLDGSAGTDRSIYFRNQGTIGGQVKSDTNLSLWAGNGSGTATQYLTIKEGGNVGIGTTNPNYKLQVDGTLRTTGTVTLNGANLDLKADNARILIEEADGTDITWLGDHTGGGHGALFLYNHGGAPTVKLTADTHANYINNGNNFGIGTASPNAKLEIKGASSTNYLQFNNSSDAELFRIDSNFRWAWGTTTPEQDIDFRDTSGNRAFALNRSTSSVRVGNVLSTHGHPNADNFIVGDITGSATGLTIVGASGSSGNIHFSDGTSSGNANIQGQLVYAHNDNSMRFYTAVAEKMRLTSTGHLTLNHANHNFSGANNSLLAASNGYMYAMGGTAGLYLADNSALHNAIGIRDAGHIDFNTGGTGEKMRIASDGAVTLKPNGITTGLRLQGRSSDNNFFVQWNNNTGGTNYASIGTDSGNDTLQYAANNHKFVNQLTNTEYMRIDSGGNVGIAKTSLATWSSGYKSLQIGGKGFVGAHSSSDLYIGQNASFNSGWKYEASAAASLTQHSGGKITQFVAAAGTAGNAITWNRAIDINPTGEVAMGLTPSNGIALKIGNSANNSAVTRVTNGTVSVDLTASSGGKAYLEVGSNHPLILATNATERMQITAAGDVSVASGGGLYFGGGTRTTSTNAQAYIKESGLNLDIKGNDNVRLLGDGANVILHADYTGRVGINLAGAAAPLSTLSVNGVITSGNFAAASISGSIGDANTAEVGPGYINLARDDTADAAQIRFGKNGSVHSYLETRVSGLGFVASAGHSFEGGLLAVGVRRDGLGTSYNRKLWVKGSAAFESHSGGTANPSLLNNTAIYLGPGSTRATSVTNPGTMGYADAGTGLLSGGIAWDHLRNYQTYGNITYGERPHGWLGSELHSTPGYELSNMVMATREATASNSETKVAMRWNATGEITTPRNPAFHAYGTNMTSQTTEGNHGTWNEVHDRGANFAAGTNAKFTAPVDGIYAFYAQCNFNNASVRPYYWRAVKNNTNMGVFYDDGSSETWSHIQAFITVVMDKNDTFEWRYKGDPDEGSNWCQQGGYLIG